MLCKGKVKASVELGLSFLACNMTRAVTMVGIKALIEAMREETSHFFDENRRKRQ